MSSRSFLNHYDFFLSLTIRQLKAHTARLHKKYGAIISKLRWGVRYSDMTKTALAKALHWAGQVRAYQPSWSWKHWQSQSGRLAACFIEGDQPHTNYIGFATEQEAWRMHHYLLRQGSCEACVVRKGFKSNSRTSYPWEVKTWGLDSLAWKRLLERDLQAA